MDGQVGMVTQVGAPRITVGLPVYNGAPFLRRAIDSILASTFADFELIVSDNGSTDETPAICADYARRDPRVRVITQSHNIGPVRNFQAVVYPATGEFFMWMADDDIWSPTFMQSLMDELDAHPKAVVAMCAVDRMREMDGKTLDIRRFDYVNIENGGSRIANFGFLTSSTKVSLFIYGLFRTKVMKQAVGLFPHALGGDRQFLCQFALAGEFRYVDEVLYKRAVRLSHEWSYRLWSSKPKTLLRQFFSFCFMMLRSPIVPWRHKAILPYYAALYAKFIVAHALSNLKHLKAAKLRQQALGSMERQTSMKSRLTATTRKALGGLAKLAVLGGAIFSLGLFAASAYLASRGQRAEVVHAFLAAGVVGAMTGTLYVARLLRSVARRQTQRSPQFDAHYDDLRTGTVRLFNKGFKTVHAELRQGHGAIDERIAAIDESLRSLRDETLRVIDDSLATIDAKHHLAGSLTAMAVSEGLATSDANVRGAIEKHVKVALTDTLRVMNKGFRAVENNVFSASAEIRRLTDLLLLERVDAVDDPSPQVLLSQYAKNRLNMMRKEVLFAQVADASRLKELYLAEIFPHIDEVAVPIGAMNELTGHANKADMLIVCAVAKHHGARRIFEFGTHIGRTSYNLMKTNEEAQVVTLDIGPDSNLDYADYIGNFYRQKDDHHRITQLFADSRTFDTKPYAGSFDFVFVDADHSYDGVKNDTRKALELVGPGGIVMWHDYAPKSPGLVEFICEFTKSQPLFRIKNTPLLLHIDGVDPLTFKPHPLVQSLELEAMSNDVYKIDAIYHS